MLFQRQQWSHGKDVIGTNSMQLIKNESKHKRLHKCFKISLMAQYLNKLFW